MANKMTPQQVADLVCATNGVYAGAESRFPQPSKNLSVADVWSEFCEAAKATAIGGVVDGGEFVADRIVCDGRLYTFVAFSWDNGGFDGAAICDGHAGTLNEARDMWLGHTSIHEYSEDHPIHDLIEDNADEEPNCR